MEHRKVVIIGAGHVGSHCAYALASAGDCEEIVLVDLLPEKAAAQALDVADSASFMDHAVTVRAGGYGECKDAALVVIAIGEPRLPGQTRLDLLGRSVELLKTLANELKPLRLTCPVVTITNPADIVADWLRRALELERWQCFSTGTLLDTARLVRCVSQGAGVDRRSVSAFCLGEHGDSSMVPFSAVTVGGVPFKELGLSKEDILSQTHQAGMDIIEGKGSTEFGIGRAPGRKAHPARLRPAGGGVRPDRHPLRRPLPHRPLRRGESRPAGAHPGGTAPAERLLPGYQTTHRHGGGPLTAHI